ncbi:MAG: deoxyribodipyrimidine photolyase [Crocinitomicaceae bacterium]|jgi:deoxyribodipyrimidine photo-lyase|nr:deoxyribodipyrimidine photolyase [Crocinitomicaceae bacterium]
MKALFWHRRDLRISDNAALYYALKENAAVQPVFVFDQTILAQLAADDQRVIFIYRQVESLKQAYRDAGSDLLVLHGDPRELIPGLCLQTGVSRVYANKDYEPQAIERDRFVFETLNKAGITFIAKKDQVIFEKNEILKADGCPYTVFTPYMRRWKEKLNAFYLESYPVEKYLHSLAQSAKTSSFPSLEELGFGSGQKVDFPAQDFPEDIIKKYSEQRDFPALNATSRLSVHLRFGTVSIRQLVRKAKETNETFLNELIWRDFYQAILYHFPHSANASFKKQYDFIPWENNEAYFRRWCEGKTGYPLVDAGMRELNATGFMHNRVRMVVASFLCKHLLIDWRWGERYFAEKLLDYELASNTGGWQWAAGCGCDAAPYFRVFNPEAQQQKFDPKLEYIRRWVPEYGTEQYPGPIVEHKEAREKAIHTYKKALNP